MSAQIGYQLGRMFRAVLFDLFGTLTPCYPLEDVRLTIAAMADDLGVPGDAFSAAWNDTFAGRQRSQFATLAHNVCVVLDALGCNRSQAEVGAACRRRMDFERGALAPRPDALVTLHALRTAGVRTALVSNCSMETPAAWAGGVLCGALDVDVFSCMVGWAKPDERIYRHACQALAVDPEDCLFVGDGSSDELRGAQAVGMRAALIRAGDDDETFPNRLDRDSWKGSLLRSVTETLDLLGLAPT